MIEAVQRHAARYVTNNYSSYASVSDMHIYTFTMDVIK